MVKIKRCLPSMPVAVRTSEMRALGARMVESTDMVAYGQPGAFAATVGSVGVDEVHAPRPLSVCVE
jgi:hypothetical protein